MGKAIKDIIDEMPRVYKYSGILSILFSIVVFLGIDQMTAYDYYYQGNFNFDRRSPNVSLIIVVESSISDRQFYRGAIMQTDIDLEFVIDKIDRTNDKTILVVSGDELNHLTVSTGTIMVKERTYLDRIVSFLQ